MDEYSNFQPIKFWRVYVAFNGCGFDFDSLGNYVGVDKLKNEEKFTSCLNQQISNAENEFKISFQTFKRILIKTPLEDYAETLFVVLCRLNEKYYNPFVSYCYKKPSEKQKKLIAKMLEIYPYKDVKVKITDEDGEEDEELHSEDDPSRQKEFSIDIGGNSVLVNDYAQQKNIYNILVDDYIRQGLDQVYYHGEENSFTYDDHLIISEHHLTQQLKGNRGGKNKMDFIRDIIYKLKFLIDVEDWAKKHPDFYANFPMDYRPGFVNEYYESSKKRPLSRKDASLIAEILEFFGLYNAGSYNDRSARIIGLYKSSHLNIQTYLYMMGNMGLLMNKLANAIKALLMEKAKEVEIDNNKTVEKM